MSYEGEVQAICSYGHYSCFPEPYGKYPACPKCQASFSWINRVDETNSDAVGVIPDEVMETFVKARTPSQVCNLGHTHEEVIYRIPSEEETRAAQHYWNGKKYVPIPVIPLQTTKKPNARKKK